MLIFLLFADIRWKKFDVIYYEYGALVMLFNSGEMVSKAYHILSNASFDDKQFLVLLLPNIQVSQLLLLSLGLYSLRCLKRISGS